jgi:hypothetical protein
LLARLTTARHSKDLDVFLSVNDADAEHAVNALRTASHEGEEAGYGSA